MKVLEERIRILNFELTESNVSPLSDREGPGIHQQRKQNLQQWLMIRRKDTWEWSMRIVEWESEHTFTIVSLMYTYLHIDESDHPIYPASPVVHTDSNPANS